MSEADLQREIARLPERSRAELLDRWERLYGMKPPQKISRNLLIRSIAYRMQEEVHGGLSAATKRRLLRLAEDVRERGDAAITTMPRIKPGTRFVREWQGTLHHVTVTAAGFEWQGGTYRSLSEIARLITGTRWNGWTFFGARRAGRSRAGAGSPAPDGIAAPETVPKKASPRPRATAEALHV